MLIDGFSLPGRVEASANYSATFVYLPSGAHPLSILLNNRADLEFFLNLIPRDSASRSKVPTAESHGWRSTDNGFMVKSVFISTEEMGSCKSAGCEAVITVHGKQPALYTREFSLQVVETIQRLYEDTTHLGYVNQE